MTLSRLNISIAEYGDQLTFCELINKIKKVPSANSTIAKVN